MVIQNYYRATILSLGAMLGVTAMVGGIIASNRVLAEDDTSVVDQINITVPVSCTISGTGQNTHNANINNGLYEDDIGTTTLHAFCNDNEGFAIYAAGYTGNEVGGESSNKLVGTNASNNATIESGIATTAGNPDVSNWAMKLTMTQDSGDTTTGNAFTIDSAPNVSLPSQAEQSATSTPFSQYHVVPNEYTKVAHKNSNTDMTESTGGAKLTTTYAAYISKTQAADTYSGQVIYTLVHPASRVAPGELNPDADHISEVTYLQDFALVNDENLTSIIASMVPEQQYVVMDIRDNKTYTIAKYETGIWMTKNLDHDIVTDGSVVYDNTTTDLGWTGTGYSTASWIPSVATYDASTTTWNYSDTTPESYDPGELYWNGELYPADQVSCEAAGGEWYVRDGCYHVNLTDSTGNPHYHLGNYYNWTAAVAMNDSSNYTTQSVVVNQSICPAGWTLPLIDNNGSGSIYSLWNQYGFSNNSYNDANSNNVHDANENALWTSPLYFAASGSFTTGNFIDFVGDAGNFWTPVSDGSGSAESAHFDVSGHTDLSSGVGLGEGNSIRCVLRSKTME